MRTAGRRPRGEASGNSCPRRTRQYVIAVKVERVLFEVEGLEGGGGDGLSLGPVEVQRLLGPVVDLEIDSEGAHAEVVACFYLHGHLGRGNRGQGAPSGLMSCDRRALDRRRP